MTAVTELHIPERSEEEVVAPEQSASGHEDRPFSPEERLKLRAWVIKRHSAYVSLALEIADMESGKSTNGPQSDVTYEKLRRARQKYQEAQSVLKALVDVC